MSYYHWMEEMQIMTQNGVSFKVSQGDTPSPVRFLDLKVRTGDYKYTSIANITSLDVDQLIEFFTFLKTVFAYMEDYQ